MILSWKIENNIYQFKKVYLKKTVKKKKRNMLRVHIFILNSINNTYLEINMDL